MNHATLAQIRDCEELDDGVSHNVARFATVSLSSSTAESARLTESH